MPEGLGPIEAGKKLHEHGEGLWPGNQDRRKVTAFSSHREDEARLFTKV